MPIPAPMGSFLMPYDSAVRTWPAHAPSSVRRLHALSLPGPALRTLVRGLAFDDASHRRLDPPCVACNAAQRPALRHRPRMLAVACAGSLSTSAAAAALQHARAAALRCPVPRHRPRALAGACAGSLSTPAAAAALQRARAAALRCPVPRHRPRALAGARAGSLSTTAAAAALQRPAPHCRPPPLPPCNRSLLPHCNAPRGAAARACSRGNAAAQALAFDTPAAALPAALQRPAPHPHSRTLAALLPRATLHRARAPHAAATAWRHPAPPLPPGDAPRHYRRPAARSRERAGARFRCLPPPPPYTIPRGVGFDARRRHRPVPARVSTPGAVPCARRAPTLCRFRRRVLRPVPRRCTARRRALCPPCTNPVRVSTPCAAPCAAPLHCPPPCTTPARVSTSGAAPWRRNPHGGARWRAMGRARLGAALCAVPLHGPLPCTSARRF
ncbi:hypothetical protein GGX14DRAFT_559016 [Mycena pura]|uniref:Uncharacterized protein n=1 Tax=Mycena pura TaxID=153505 RepID=A0AAD6VSL7_9AGAR|nr:hypothetical protein GGX14DRAFT_559016 [Mycena pura]